MTGLSLLLFACLLTRGCKKGEMCISVQLGWLPPEAQAGAPGWSSCEGQLRPMPRPSTTRGFLSRRRVAVGPGTCSVPFVWTLEGCPGCSQTSTAWHCSGSVPCALRSWQYKEPSEGLSGTGEGTLLRVWPWLGSHSWMFLAYASIRQLAERKDNALLFCKKPSEAVTSWGYLMFYWEL